jgi:MFS family permease
MHLTERDCMSWLKDKFGNGQLVEEMPDTLRFPWSKATAPAGLVAMLALPVALLGGALSGHPAAGAIATGSAFTVGFAVFHPVMRSVLFSMLLVTLGIASATLAGSLSAKWTVAVLVVVAVSALNYGLLADLGASAGWIAQQSAVFLVVATYFPDGLQYAVGRSAMVLLGGLLQMGLYAAFHWRDKPLEGEPPLRQAVVEHAQEYWVRVCKKHAWTADTLGYAARLIVTLVVGTAIYRWLHLRNGYWIPMTALLVLKHRWAGTLSRSLARVLGTCSGAAVAYGLAQLHPWPGWLIIALIMVCAFVCFAVQAVNYALFSLALTLYIVFLFRFGGFSQTSAAHLRLINTVIGGALALVVDGVWAGAERVFGAGKLAKAKASP